MTAARFFSTAMLLASAASGCGGPAVSPATDGGSDGAAPDLAGGNDVPFVDAPTSFVRDGVRRDDFLVPGFTPPKNPTTGDETPAQYNATQVLRYRQDADPPVAVKAILVGMPGFLEGGAGFDALARALVTRGAASGNAVEVWAIDRRANLLEDRRGTYAAAAVQNPEAAEAYYFGDGTVGGQAFPGFVAQEDVPYMSEWGLETHVEDLRRVIALVPAAQRQAHVFLVGHSLGGGLMEAYAAWRFADGSRGIEDAAGLVLIEGTLDDAPLAEADYQAGYNAGGFPTPGLGDIRASTRFVALPLLGVDIYAHIEVMSLRLFAAPTGVVADDGRDEALQLLLSLRPGQVPPLDNTTALGLAFDDQSNPLEFARYSLGHATGGPFITYADALGGSGMIERPSDAAGHYTWVDALDADPKEWTPIANLAHSFVDGRSNFPEWYFPARLAIDIAACGGGALDPASWQAGLGLRAFDEAKIDAPILGIRGERGLLSPSAFDAVKARVAPAIGAGRAHAGATRADPAAFTTLVAAGLTHADPLLAADRPENLVPSTIEAFVNDNAGAGTVGIPRM